MLRRSSIWSVAYRVASPTFALVPLGETKYDATIAARPAPTKLRRFHSGILLAFDGFSSLYTGLNTVGASSDRRFGRSQKCQPVAVHVDA
jgi:hypothetical protein